MILYHYTIHQVDGFVLATGRMISENELIWGFLQPSPRLYDSITKEIFCVEFLERLCQIQMHSRSPSMIQFLISLVQQGFTYVGELCRFLLAQPPGEYDKKHSIRLCTGNGLRQNLWTSFVNRFNIRNIYEFYAATESNAYFCKSSSSPPIPRESHSIYFQLILILVRVLVDFIR